jgi:hypothetical protein
VQLKRNLRTTPGVTHEALARFGEFCPTTPLLQILGKSSLAIASLCDGKGTDLLLKQSLHDSMLLMAYKRLFFPLWKNI